MIRTLGIAALIAAGVSAPVAAQEIARADRPFRVFAGEERGPYRTGTMEIALVDESRAEAWTSDPSDKRHLMIQLWYPADYAGDPARAAYALSPQLYSAATRDKWLPAMSGVVGNSVLGARVAAGTAPFPVLVYNPGAGNPHFTGTYQTEYLASHGYVVVAIGHTGTSGIERFPDGYRYVEDRPPQGFDLTPEQRKLSEAEQYQQRERNMAANVMPVHVADIAFVLDHLGRMNRDGAFKGRLDLDAVGVFGFSLGGALSLQAGRDIPRVKAAANLDGWLYTDVSVTGTDRPILLIRGLASDGERPAQDRELELVADSRFWRLLSRTRADWYNVEIRNTLHRYFSDRMLFEPEHPEFLHPRMVHAIVNRYVLAFFDRYVKGEPATADLTAGRQYPGVTVESHRFSPTPAPKAAP